MAVNAERLAAWCGRHGIAGRLCGDEFVAIAHRAPDLDSIHRADLEWRQEGASGGSTWGAPSARRPRGSLLVRIWCGTLELVQATKKPPATGLGLFHGAGDENRTRALSLGITQYLRDR
ncbi:hypothetical protein [Streptomyces sp. NPDC001933]|uniref:hypothetical protein n=1 Tax=Streptomyces sp. NPDC001933 TaxID=3364626 RepID=UPI0036C44042